MLNTKLKKLSRIMEVLILIGVSVVPYIPAAVKITLAVMVLLFGMYREFTKKETVYINRSFLFVMLFFAIAAALDVRNVTDKVDYSLVNLMYPFYFVCGYFCARQWDCDELYETLEKIVFVLALLSFIGMAIIYLTPAWVKTFPTYRYNDATHRTIYIFNFLFSGDWMAPRNSGIAWEPGVFQILLNIALQVTIQNKTGKSLFVRVVVYVLAIVLTRSTMGYMVLAVNLLCLVMKHRQYLPMLIATAVLGSSLVAAELIYQIQNKLAGSSAFSARYDPMINAFKYAWYRPFGLGSTRYNMEYEVLRLGSFDSYTQILLRYGFLMLCCIVERLIKIFREDNKWMCIILALSFFSEPVWGTLLFVVLFYVKNDNRGVKICE